METYPQSAVIKVIGVGGGGGNAVHHMVKADIEGVDFICANTDAQALKNMHACSVLQLQEALAGADMVFITAGMGGGTGTGAAPVIAQVARELGILAVAVVTKPFAFEGNRRMKVAEQGIRELSEHVDSLITIPNARLQEVLGPQMTLLNAFSEANNVLQGAVQGIAELITRPGLINVDFADVRTVMSEMGMAMMGSGTAGGEGRAREAAEAAINSPLLDNIDLAGARGILVNITAGPDMAIGEFEEVGSTVKAELRVTVVATGLGTAQARQQVPPKVEIVRDKGTGDPDWQQYEKPPTQRNRPVPPIQEGAAAPQMDYEYLDIPAFLRKQAD
jgi:cell division protein FtsZ